MGTIQEYIDDSYITAVYLSMTPTIRKRFLTFQSVTTKLFANNKFLDMSTFNTSKYNSFSIMNDNVQFDRDFLFKMRINLSSICQDGHYSYTSRQIRVSNTSTDITKGYDIVSEQLSYNDYKIVSDPKNKTTEVFNFNISAEPISIPYTEIKSLPTDNRLTNKLQNIILLA